jgi:hypothetical protein
MKGAIMFLLGAALGILAALNLFPPKGPTVRSGNATLQVKTGRDTIVINSKNYDTVVINARKDTIVIHTAYSEYCNQIPRPPDCPPLIDTTLLGK